MFHIVYNLTIERKYVVDIDKNIDITKITPSTRVALHNDSYVLHLILPSKVDPLVNLMKVEKVPDSTYDMIGGLDQQIKEIKEAVCTESGMFALRERRVDVTQEDFEMVVAKVMKKETEKNMSLRKLWK
ncbi:26S proteasome regulatory subunit 8 homolog A-like [Quercus robur]|uniref:26S proteasome regulatory subunit 8 homolog A-like n=1 Tax=Quercus robur TaxID=38942 RepID=UPI0021632084|nr:26S proteasome regulatory subunit 8 homolog A-like [Quercus robur]XP_050285049.1 26S proteasome regulatory subunit 8 homolog A-like [Quercus robur]